MRRPYVGRAAVTGLTGEDRFEQWVIAVARMGGWRGIHVRKSFGVMMGVSPRDAFGDPDWRFWNTRKRRYIFRELKTQRGVVRPEQTEIIAEMVLCGMDAKVWRPSDEQEIRETFAP